MTNVILAPVMVASHQDIDWDEIEGWASDEGEQEKFERFKSFVH